MLSMQHLHAAFMYTGPLDITPRFGSHLGGTAIFLKGPCFTELDRIECMFDKRVSVTGVYLNPGAAVCISPRLESVGWKALDVLVARDEEPIFEGNNRFYAGMLTKYVVICQTTLICLVP